MPQYFMKSHVLFLSALLAFAAAFRSPSRGSIPHVKLSPGTTEPKSIVPFLSNAARRNRMVGLKAIVSDTIRGFEARAQYDDTFKNKVVIELIVGFLTQSLAEVSERGPHSFEQIDYIIADLIQGLCASFFAVYLSAPVNKDITECDNTDRAPTSFECAFVDSPENAFQKVLPGGPEYSVTQRIRSIVKAAPQLFATGFIGMSFGSFCTWALSFIRLLFGDGINGTALVTALSNDLSINSISDELLQAVSVGCYLAVSTNIRYQLVAGVIEGRIIDPIFKEKYPNAILLSGGSFLVRTANTYFGSYMMVQYLQLLGVQH